MTFSDYSHKDFVPDFNKNARCYIIKYSYQEIITNYYKKNYVKKDCWEVTQTELN